MNMKSVTKLNTKLRRRRPNEPTHFVKKYLSNDTVCLFNPVKNYPISI